MLHPVGPLPAAVYWWRRFLVLAVVLGLLGGAGWLGLLLVAHRPDRTPVTTAAATTSRAPVAPALDQVVPALAGVVTSRAVAPATTAAPVPGGPCSDAMLRLEVQAPLSASAAARPTFDLVLTNVSPVPCVRALDERLRQILMFDTSGARVWGSTDCAAESTPDQRTLAPGETVSFAVLWSGLTSDPTCTSPRVAPKPGSYVLRGRLGTLTGPDSPIALT